jgi:hypothetical protein
MMLQKKCILSETKFDDHLRYMSATEHAVTGIEKDIDKI